MTSLSTLQYSCLFVSDSLWPHRLKHIRPPCPSPPTPRPCSNSCPSNQWCHPTISSSVVPFFSCSSLGLITTYEFRPAVSLLTYRCFICAKISVIYFLMLSLVPRSFTCIKHLAWYLAVRRPSSPSFLLPLCQHMWPSIHARKKVNGPRVHRSEFAVTQPRFKSLLCPFLTSYVTLTQTFNLIKPASQTVIMIVSIS